MSANRSSASEWTYRPALDGLRAVAVLAVFVYHLGYRWFPGGFLGVDIFFVLSGYLITGLLLVEADRNERIDLPAFWLRRAKRLLPALLVLLAAVAWWLAATATPFVRSMRRGDLLWTLFYGANWHFIASGQDYFAQFVTASPLRHTWSLAIEEQFYLVWPLLLASAVAFRWRPRRFVAVVSVVAALVSALAAARLFDPRNLTRAYFGTDARVHELFVGALLASLAAGPTRSRTALGGTAATVGGLALIIAFLSLSDRNPLYYRGLSLTVSIATALLIWGLEIAPSGAVARLLSWRPVRWVGEISYGVYLWHWPVILAVSAAIGPLTLLPGASGMNLTRVLLTFGISALSFYLIEQPFRRGRVWFVGTSRLRLIGVIGIAVISIVGLSVAVTRVPVEAASAEPEGCPGSGTTPCVRLNESSAAPVVALIGDSIARSLDVTMKRLAFEHGWTYVLAAGNGCRLSHLLTSYQGQTRQNDQKCYDNTPVMLSNLMANWHPAMILAIDRWEIIDALSPEGRILVAGTPDHLKQTEQALVEMATPLTAAGARLAFIELPPLLPDACSDQSKWTAPECRKPADDALQTAYNGVFRRVAAQVNGATTISLTEAVCPGGICAWARDGIVLRFDGLHFTPDASRFLVPLINKQLIAHEMIPKIPK